MLPENRSQGTIAQALRAVLTADVPLSLDEIFLALPIGWSRTDAISGLKEGALDGWVNFGPDGWQLVGEPPETEAESPLSVARIPNYSQHRLQEISGDLRAQLYDAVTLQKESALIRALAISYDEVGKALAIVSD